MAVAARNTERTGGHRKPQKIRRNSAAGKRRSRILGSKLGRFLLAVIALAFVFAYVNEYAALKIHGYSRSSLMQTRDQELQVNEQLKVELLKLSSPQQVVSNAKQVGLVYATEYDYLQAPRVMVRAQGSR